MVYVLSKVYGIERDSIRQSIEAIADIDEYLFENQNVILYALTIYAFSKLDFVDCLLIGYSKIKGYNVFTFDKKLKNRL
ncbi:MAG: hypothetical protein LBE91_04865 [Tannerella sp.]|jgi:predicted nucleic-acid-binding protein|nr:hypothetical protein [Tannerella sp.]